jgi:hypothetical protein
MGRIEPAAGLPVYGLAEPGVDPSEIKNLQAHQASLKEALAETRYRLDSLHLVVVES